jgi:tRNA 2-thiouridine synthesizing protein B|tara:strand:- start:6526 stop:6819 length:294 start_codon:yes stop_codon:yes gene_type:complete
VLHTVSKSPFSHSALDECAKFATKGSPILLIEDGVLAAKPGTKYEEKLKAVIEKNSVYALLPDIKARGIGKLIDGVKPIGYDGFVELVEQHKVVSWV